MDSVAKARRTLDIVEVLSEVLNTGLTRNELSILIALIENGCNPEVSGGCNSHNADAVILALPAG